VRELSSNFSLVLLLAELRFYDAPHARTHDLSILLAFPNLPGSFAQDIFDYRSDTDQNDASAPLFGLPRNGIMGLEMGLGKTVISIALIAANPPPLHRRVLPRENLWSLEKKTGSDHPAYRPPPHAGRAKGSLRRLSNGTLIFVPQTLLSQWVFEFERFAPHLSVISLHSTDKTKTTIQNLAATDIVIVSMNVVHQAWTKGNNLLNMLKRIHFHRILVDEAHQATEDNLLHITAISSTHRYSVTGTPIGSQLADLYRQVRYLRLAPFHRPGFWKNLMEDPYYERNTETLRVLRSLLSCIVVRFSKEQTSANGASLLALPPRTVETVLLKFGSLEEAEVYRSIDTRNRNKFTELKRQSNATVAVSVSRVVPCFALLVLESVKYVLTDSLSTFMIFAE